MLHLKNKKNPEKTKVVFLVRKHADEVMGVCLQMVASEKLIIEKKQ